MSVLLPIRVAPGGRYFERSDGQPFLFIGPNDAIPWQGLRGLVRRRDVAAAEGYLADLARHGVTTLRVMMEYFHRSGYALEGPVGAWNPVMVAFWDDFIPLCERYGLRLLLSPWDTFWMSRRWRYHPYNRANGGPAESCGAFLTDEATLAATERRLRFFIERWGGSGAIGAWDLFNEIDPFWGGSPTEQAGAIERLSRAVRESEQRCWSFTRPQTLSVFGPAPRPEYEELIFRHPALDFATTHVYSEGTIDDPRDTITPAVTMAHWVRYALERTPAGRPYTDSEHGPIHLFNDHRRALPEPFDDEYEHHLIWAHLATGGAGSGMRWPARHPHLITAGMRRSLASVAAFTPLLDWRHFDPCPCAEEIELGADWLIPFGCRDERQALLWLLRALPPHQPEGMLPEREALREVPVTLPGLLPGDYDVAFWETRAGQEAGRQQVTVGRDRRLRLVVPQIATDIAIAIRPAAPTP